MLEHSSTLEHERNNDWEDLLDPFWMTKSQLSDDKINVGDEKYMTEEEDVVLIAPLEEKKDLDGKSEFKEPRADNVHYAGLFANKNTERIHNSYSTAYMNAHADKDQCEEVYRRKRKKAKKLMKAKERLKKVLKKYEDCFARDPSQPPGTVSEDLCKHVIELKEGSDLGWSPGMRVKSENDNKFITATIEKLLAFGLIRRVDANFASQVHIVKVPGKDPRFCVDYRQVNAATKPDPFPLPRMDELLYGFRGSTIFSTLDAQKGFWQVKLGKGAEFSAFRTKKGVFQWTVMPMGLMNAPATFQRFMDMVFGDLSFVKVYIDDIIIASKNVEEHLFHVGKVLQRCRKNGITLKVSKCHFLKRSIKFRILCQCKGHYSGP